MPLPDITWSHDDEVKSFTQYKSRVSTLKFTPKEQEDFGSYECTASNLLGSTKQIITIVMLGKFHPRRVMKTTTTTTTMTRRASTTIQQLTDCLVVKRMISNCHFLASITNQKLNFSGKNLKTRIN